MFIVGVDLSGPSNTADTVLVAFETRDSSLELRQCVLGATDTEIFDSVTELARQSEVAVGIDAPLSYNLGGGDRSSDADLRQHAIKAGLHPGSIMPPTMNRMVYLTLRGVSLARLLLTIQGNPTRITEVHPGATMALRGAPVDAIRSFKNSEEARGQLLDWLERQGLGSAATAKEPSDHYVAACAAALAAWKWQSGESVWLHRAEPPIHPFDYAC